MSVEGDLVDALKPLVTNAGTPTTHRVYADVAPEGAIKPFITFQQVGGQPLNFLNGIPDKRSGRFQINVWAATRVQAMALIRQAEDILRLSTVLRATTQGGAVAIYEEDTKLYGARQDFAITFQA